MWPLGPHAVYPAALASSDDPDRGHHLFGVQGMHGALPALERPIVASGEDALPGCLDLVPQVGGPVSDRGVTHPRRP